MSLSGQDRLDDFLISKKGSQASACLYILSHMTPSVNVASHLTLKTQSLCKKH